MRDPGELPEHVRRNRAQWDAWAAQYVANAEKNWALAEPDWGIWNIPESEVGMLPDDLAGKDAIELGCGTAYVCAWMARRGARVVGVDFSPAALEKARTLARRCEVRVDFVEADATKLPVDLHNKFDLVYATIGVIVWIDDLRAWMRSAAAALRGGGKLMLVDIHPLTMMLASVDPLAFDFPYGFDGPRSYDEPGSYAGADLPVSSTQTVEYGHSLGEIIMAALGAGLKIQHVQEHLEADFDPRGNLLEPDEDGRYRVRADGEVLPMLFTLIAAKP